MEIKPAAPYPVTLFVVFRIFSAAAVVAEPGAEPMRMICFGAHPDVAEDKSGGVAAMWAAQGCRVKLVSVANGDIGHWAMAGGPLAVRRTTESAAVAKRLGVESQVRDIHDGERLPTLENRRQITRLLRE
ncbi:MAG: PIG-L family deacetylase [Pirellulales bacterium]